MSLILSKIFYLDNFCDFLLFYRILTVYFIILLFTRDSYIKLSNKYNKNKIKIKINVLINRRRIIKNSNINILTIVYASLDKKIIEEKDVCPLKYLVVK